MFNIEDYLTRINWPNPKERIECNLNTLIKLQHHHSTAITFDNFDLHISGTPLCVDPTYVWHQIKNSTRGTYCFQGNYLFLTALHKLGFSDALLIPVCPWRPRMNAFTQLMSHCCIIVPLDGQWVFVDVSTVDCLDGVLILSDKLETEQTLMNGARYQFRLVQDKEIEFSDEILGKILAVEPGFLSTSSVTIAMLKEELKRDEISQDPTEPWEFLWENRFSFRLPKKNPEDIIPKDKISYLPDIVTLPPSLHQKIAEILLEYSTIKDPRSHHFKQWVGIRYSKEYKYIVAGFRYIVVKRPYAKRSLTWCGNLPPPQREPNNPVELGKGTVPEIVMKEVLQHLREDIGIILTEEQINCLKINDIYLMPNIDHVWSY